MGGGAYATAFEESKAGAIAELEKADVYSGTYDMSWRRRTVAHVSCVQFADRLSVKSRHWVVVGRHRPTTAGCSIPRQISAPKAIVWKQAC
jgi:hypothetical protein